MLHVTLRQLQMFDAVAQFGSFSKAAQAMHLSQPAVSMQVKQLEAAAGLALFEQVGKKIYLTDAGREVQAACQGVAHQLTDLDNTLNDLKGLRQGSLVVGVVSTASHFAARIMARFRQQHPEMRLTLNVVNRGTLLSQLANNAIDLAIMGKPPEGQDLDAQPFMDNPLVVIAPPGHLLATRKAIPLKNLVEHPFLAREVGSGTRSSVEAFFQSHGLVLKVDMEMNANEAIKKAVEVGLGLGVVSQHTIDAELDRGRLCILDVEDFPIRRQWYLVSRQNKRFSIASQSFADFILDEAAGIALNT